MILQIAMFKQWHKNNPIPNSGNEELPLTVDGLVCSMFTLRGPVSTGL